MLAENLQNVEERIQVACARANRDRNEVTLIAVSKTKPVSMLEEVYAEGIRCFGENKVQELTEKHDKLPSDVKWHMIGHLQRNKVKYIVDKVSLIHSVDKYSLLLEIDKRAGKIGKVMDVLIEVNSGKEESKSGIFPEDVYDFYKKACELKSIRVRGLMTMAPRCQSREEYLKYFGLTKEIFDNIFGNDENAILSMGMSESYEYALEAGATLVRVGSKIFGERKY